MAPMGRVDTSKITATIFPPLTLPVALVLLSACVTANEWGPEGSGTAHPPSSTADDADGDFISDADEDAAAGVDTDGDGVPDARDQDSDDDGIPDSVEAGDADRGTPPRDSDADGVPDFRDIDSDDNGLFDFVEGAGDTDGDGVPDFQDDDNDGDGRLDRAELGGSPSTPPDSDGDGVADFLDFDDGSVVAEEICDQLDNDGNGEVDEACSCDAGANQPCYGGPASTRGVGACQDGTQSCLVSGEFASWGACEGMVVPGIEICHDEQDNDCDGLTDCLDDADCGPCHENCADGEDDDYDGLVDCEDPDCPPCAEICDNGIDDDLDGLIDCDDPDCTCIIDLDVDLRGDCLFVSCPPEAPYPVACHITMDGGDHRGCVASTPTGARVYFQEGDACGAGRLYGTLSCSSVVGAGLNEANCWINKPTRYYPRDRSGCPETDG